MGRAIQHQPCTSAPADLYDLLWGETSSQGIRDVQSNAPHAKSLQRRRAIGLKLDASHRLWPLAPAVSPGALLVSCPELLIHDGSTPHRSYRDGQGRPVGRALQVV